MVRWVKGVVAGLAVLVAAGWLIMFRPWQGAAKPPGEEFAADREPTPADPVPFDAQRAMGYLEAICKIGPRISGSDGMKQQQELLRKHFEALGATVELQPFTVRQRSQTRPVDMANMIVHWHPERNRRLVLCSHYDTRPIADQEPDRRRWQEPFLSANDGASGLALLMEMGNHVKDLKTTVGVDFVFFDGEEYIFDPRPQEQGGDKYFYGSERFAQVYRQTRGKSRYLGAILLDMVGGKDARFPIERGSWMKAGALVQQVWQIAERQKCSAFLQDEFSRVEVFDDHLALNRAGIPAIDLIDFDYKHWHRLSDVPANCSGETLEQVARVLSVWLQQVK